MSTLRIIGDPYDPRFETLARRVLQIEIQLLRIAEALRPVREVHDEEKETKE
jgi:hypothetical protein